MRPQKKFALVFIVFGFQCASRMCEAQQLDLYSRLLDPIALARLDEPDFAPMRLTYGVPFDYLARDPLDTAYFLYAEDTGSGVLTHLYVTSRTPDSITNFHLYIDGKLYRSAGLDSFFKQPLGVMHAPFDTIIGEARLCDVQIPYRHGFRLDYKSPNPKLWYDYGWRPLPANVLLPKTGDVLDTSTAVSQRKAEDIFRNPKLLWKNYGGSDSNFAATLLPKSDTTLLTMYASGVVRTLKILPDAYNVSLDSVWIDIFWDEEERPSFSAPLMALFGQSYDFRDLHSLPIDFSQSNGFEMRFPMPFAHSMRIAFRNQSSRAFRITGGVTWFPYAVDPATLGYLHTRFNEIGRTRWAVPHHVLHIKGKGKYCGLLMGIHNLQQLATYEGDAMFRIDSNDAYAFHYEGTEDYFNGAQYFSNKEFMSPFGGTSNIAANYYRFHYLDEIDFNTSLDFDFQHGVNNNCWEHYRTLPFWYEQHIPYWTDRDTVRTGEQWAIAGASYPPNQQLTILLDAISVFAGTAGMDGLFQTTIVVPNIQPGFYTLTVNGIRWPEKIFVQHGPSLQILTDPKPVRLQTNDTVEFSGEGWIPGDSVRAIFDGVPTKVRTWIDSLHHIWGRVIILQLETGNYALDVEGKLSGAALSDEKIFLTRTLQFECEDIWDSLSAPSASSPVNLSFTYHSEWSHVAVAQFTPTVTSKDLRLRFHVPVSDTFDVSTVATWGDRFGNYEISLDGNDLYNFVGYRAFQYFPTDTIRLGTHFLKEGIHTVSFHYLGHDAHSTDSTLWADFIRLTPTTKLPPRAVRIPPQQPLTSIVLYPEPNRGEINLMGLDATQNVNGTLAAITNALGAIVERTSLHRVSPTDYAVSLHGLAPGTYWITLPSLNLVKCFHVTQ